MRRREFDDRDALISFKRDDPEAQERLWLHHVNRTPHQGFEPWLCVSGCESGVFKQFDLHTTENVISVGLPEMEEICYLDLVYFHWCPHAVRLPVNGIKRDMELLAYLSDVFGFLACLLLFLNTIDA